MSKTIENILDKDELCMWHNMACDKNSTTFNTLRADMLYHPLYRCAYDCQGTKGECDLYVHIELQKNLEDNYLK